MAGNMVAMGQHERLAPSKSLNKLALATIGQRFGLKLPLSSEFGRVSPKGSAFFQYWERLLYILLARPDGA
mgnify:CR=1 FL=1